MMMRGAMLDLRRAVRSELMMRRNMPEARNHWYLSLGIWISLPCCSYLFMLLMALAMAISGCVLI